MLRKINIIFSLLIFSLTSSFAQSRTTAKPNSNFKPTKLYTTLGGFKDTMFISPKAADSILAMPLKIIDAKNVIYTLSTYNFLYKQIVVSEDEATGKAYNTTSIKSSFFKTTPIPPLWSKIVSERLRAGEEIIFFDVIVKDAKGRYMYARNLKLILQ
ncbi:MAG: hypothetical protein HOO89_05605 [Ferruginibacter sp.]|nr:hypothetical protein [Ferruginibacter sp.]